MRSTSLNDSSSNYVLLYESAQAVATNSHNGKRAYKSLIFEPTILSYFTQDVNWIRDDLRLWQAHQPFFL